MESREYMNIQGLTQQMYSIKVVN